MQETKTLAAYVVDNTLESIPDDVRHEARRAIVNYMGCALGGSPDAAVDLAMRALGPYSGPPIAAVLGRAERLDPLHPSLMNGLTSPVSHYPHPPPKPSSHPPSP